MFLTSLLGPPQNRRLIDVAKETMRVIWTDSLTRDLRRGQYTNYQSVPEHRQPARKARGPPPSADRSAAASYAYRRAAAAPSAAAASYPDPPATIHEEEEPNPSVQIDWDDILKRS